MDWSAIIPIGIFLIALVGLNYNQAAKYLSIREHETYTKFLTREIDTVRDRISFLEQTRPTTGELEAKLGNPQNTKKECNTRGS